MTATLMERLGEHHVEHREEIAVSLVLIRGEYNDGW